MIAVAELEGASVAELEVLYREQPMAPPPTGVWRGRMLRYLATPLVVRAVDWLMFDAPPYGIDFDSHDWWFFHPRGRLGHFEMTRGESRWRNTETLRLEYQTSRLPIAIRGLLYDEVKPIGDGICLGIGGVNRGAGHGEHFFFVLTK